MLYARARIIPGRAHGDGYYRDDRITDRAPISGRARGKVLPTRAMRPSGGGSHGQIIFDKAVMAADLFRIASL
jgi:hypothetical protein